MPINNPGPSNSAVANTRAALSAGTYLYANLPPASQYPAGTTVWVSDRGQFISNGTSWVSSSLGSTYTYATLPSASTVPAGSQAYTTDQGMFYSDGTNWQSLLTANKNLYNFSPKNYKNTRKALANVRLGVSRMNVLCLGDSITVGFIGGTAADRKVVNGYPAKLATQFGSGVVSSPGSLNGGFQSWINDHNVYNQFGGTLTDEDPRVTGFASWGIFGNQQAALGGTIVAAKVPSANTTPLLFTPKDVNGNQVATDSLDVYYYENTGYSNITILSGTGGITTPTTGGTVTMGTSQRWKKATATYTKGNNIWSVANASTPGTIILLGMVAYDSTKPEVSFINAAGGGMTLAQLVSGTNTWESWPTITQSGNALTGSPLAIISYGTNDNAQNVTQAAFTASLTTAVTGLQAVNTDVLLVIPYAPNGAGSVWQGIVNSYYNVAAQYNCALIDLTDKWVNYTSAYNAGFIASDTIHPTVVGHQDIASSISGFFEGLS